MVTVSSAETDLPAGTRITPADNIVLTVASWPLKVAVDGELTVAVPAGANGVVGIVLTVAYPDDTTEAAAVEVPAISAPKDDEDY